MKTNTFSTWVLWALTMVAASVSHHYVSPTLSIYLLAGGISILLLCSFLPLTLYAGRGRLFAPTGAAQDTGAMSGLSDEMDGRSDAVDPWEFQRSLMRMSGQRLPDRPMITKEVIMYYALILEEVSEAGDALLGLLRSTALTTEQLQDFALMRQTVASTVRSMDLTSRRVRQILQTEAFAGWAGQALTLEQARTLLDDHVDIQVVNSGFGLAAGLPAAAGYLAVGISNVSKADPATGVIQKDPSGKWIKGPRYQEPQLEKLLVEQFPDLFGRPGPGFAPTQPISML